MKQDKNFDVRLRAAVDKRLTESGLKKMALNGSNGLFQKAYHDFLDAVGKIELDYLQGIKKSA